MNNVNQIVPGPDARVPVLLAVALLSFFAACSTDEVPTVIVLPPSAPPAAPSDLTVSAASDSEVLLTWVDNSTDEDSVLVDRTAPGGATFSQIGAVGANTAELRVSGLGGLLSYDFRVRAKNAAGNSGFSNTASATTPARPATTKDALIDVFIEVYQAKAVGEYERLLHQDFSFFFSPSDVNTLGVPPQWPRVVEITSTTNMFTLQSGTTPYNQEQPPIQSFSLALTPVSAWTNAVPQEFAGTERRDYEATMTVSYVGGSVDQIGGVQEFYVVPVLVNNQTVYQVKFWRETGTTVSSIKLARDVWSTWGSVKASY